MKFFTALCLFGVVACALAKPQVHPAPPMHQGDRPSHPIAHPDMDPAMQEFRGHVMDFVKLYPRREIRKIIRSYAQDPELHATFEFMQTEEFQQILHTIAETPEMEAIGQYFEEADWPFFKEQIREATRDMQLAVSRRSTGGLSAMLDDIVAVLPKEKLRALFDEKVESSAVFRSVVEIMTSAELEALFSNASESLVIREQVAKLLEQGIDTEKILKATKALVGY